MKDYKNGSLIASVLFYYSHKDFFILSMGFSLTYIGASERRHRLINKNTHAVRKLAAFLLYEKY